MKDKVAGGKQPLAADHQHSKQNTMKTKIRHLTLIAAVATLLAGCNTVSTTSTQYIGVPTYPPSDPLKVEILRTMPTRPHVQLGEIKAEPASTSTDVAKIETVLREKAAKMLGLRREEGERCNGQRLGGLAARAVPAAADFAACHCSKPADS